MNNSNKQIAIIGAREITQVFQALGYDCFYDTTRTAIQNRLQELTAAGYQVIFILESAAALVTDLLAAQAGVPYPIIIPIPDTTNTTHYGMEQLNRNMEKAMGIKMGGNL